MSTQIGGYDNTSASKGTGRKEVTGTQDTTLDKFYLDVIHKPDQIIPIKFGDSPSIDAFARLRVSNPETIFDSKQIFSNQPLFWDDQETSGGGTSSTHSVAKAKTTLSVSATTAGTRVRQTFQRFNYQPGKSQLIFLTACIDALASGITRRVGYFDENNGLFFEADGTTLRVVRRTSTSGSPVDNQVDQSSWNLDPMDGTGPSGVTIDPTKTQILIIDFEWLGVGRVRMGFVVDGLPIYCHQFLNTNSLSDVYMSTPNLPLRYEISNDGTGVASDLHHICSSVEAEGGSQDLGILRYASTAGTHVDANSDGTLYAIIGLRLKSTHLAETVKIIDVSLSEQAGSNNFEWVVVFNPTVAGTFTYSDVANSAVQVATGATANTVTNGTYITGGHGSSGVRGGSQTSSIENSLRIGSSIDGTPDTMVLCVRPIGSTNLDIEGGITWRELS